MNIKNLAGQRFGRLLVLEQTPNRKNGCVVWKCKCDCGNEVFASSGYLVSGRKRSCGCLASEIAAQTARTGNNRRTHGMKRTKLYSIWNTMKYRCFNKNASNFKDYGGRGITVCDEWIHDFQAFYDYVSQLPNFGEVGYSLDRINNDGNYEPGNVKWSTRTEQNNNKRKKYNRRKKKWN